MVRTTCEFYFYFMEKAFFICLCVKGYVQGGLQLRTGLPTDSEGANTSWIFQACLCPHSSDTRWFRVSKLWRNLDLFFFSHHHIFSCKKSPISRVGFRGNPFTHHTGHHNAKTGGTSVQKEERVYCDYIFFFLEMFRPIDAVFTPSVIYLKYRVDTQKFLRISLIWG